MKQPKDSPSGELVKPLKKRNKTPANTPITKSSMSVKSKHKGASWMGGAHDVGRYWAVWVLMLIVFGVVLVRAFFLQVVNQDYHVKQGTQSTLSRQVIEVNRGLITDTFGVPLAANAPLVTVVFNPKLYAEEYYKRLKEIKDAQGNAQEMQKAQERLAQMDLKILAASANYPLEKLTAITAIDTSIDLADAAAVKAALPTGAGSQHLELLRQVTPEIAETVTQLEFVGVSKQTIPKRFYMQAEPNAQLIGFMANHDVDKGNKGRSGIERLYEERLAGSKGEVLVLRSAKKTTINQLEEIKPVVAGEDIALTIDSRLQYVLYKELAQVGQEQSARWASGMVVDVHTGDVLAMSSWPSFNSNNLAARNGNNERNRAVLDVFEPGSVIKPFTVAAALESGKYTPNSLINTSPGSIQVGKSLIKDGGNYGSITLAKLIQKSSNVASTKIALSLPTDSIANMQRKFGFGQKTALNFPAEAAGRVDIPKENELTRRATLSYGYGQQVTLAQITQAYATLGAGGVMHPLRLVKNEPNLPATQIISKEHANEIVAMMELVTQQGGTARQAAIEGYRVAGKTGTSRRTRPEGGYYTDQHRTIFAGVAPASNPRFAVAILVEDPRSQSYAGPVAGPVFSRVMQETLRLYNVPFDKALIDEPTQP